MLSFNQLDSSASPSSPAHRPPPPPLTSCTASTQTWFGSTNKFCMAKTHSMYSGPDLKWNATNAMWFVLAKLTLIFTRKPSSSCDKSDAVFNRYVLYTWGNKLLLLHIQISIVHTVHIVISHMLCCSTATKLCKIYYYASTIYCCPLLIYFCSMDNWVG